MKVKDHPTANSSGGQDGTVEMAGGSISLLPDGTLRRVGKSGALVFR